MVKTRSAGDLVFSPVDVATLGLDYLKFRHDHKESGVHFPISEDRIYPLLPGELMSIIARPGHCKTGLMMLWARERAKWLKANGFENRVVLYVTVEQSVEELHAFHIAADQNVSITKMAMGELTEDEWQKALKASTQRIDIPLWFIGHSVMRAGGRKPLNTDVISGAIEHVKSWGDGFVVDCLFVDYLQRLHPLTSRENPVVAYSAIVDETKDLALGFGIPAVLGVQAKREVDGTKEQIPLLDDGQWTSNIEQSSDRVLSLARPRRYVQEGNIWNDVLVQGQNQLLVTCLKQKLGEANFQRWVSYNPILNKLNDLEVKHERFDNYEQRRF